MTLMGGSELQYEGMKHLIPSNINLMLNSFNVDFGKYNIHWQHQYHDQPSVMPLRDKRILESIATIVFVSYHQKHLFETYLDIPKEKSIVLRNAITPFELKPKEKNKVNLIYTSTPFRGLSVLVMAYELMLQRNASLKAYVHLDIFSNMKLYGPHYENLNSEYNALYEYCENHSGMTYHSVVPHSELRAYQERAHLFTYPNIWEESSCISAIEAMAAGALPIVSSIGALPETCSVYGRYYSPLSTDMYNKHRFSDHAEQYSYFLEQNIIEYLNNPPVDEIQSMSDHINRHYSWDTRHKEWIEFFDFFKE